MLIIFEFLKILVNDHILTTDSGDHHPNARLYDMENDMENFEKWNFTLFIYLVIDYNAVFLYFFLKKLVIK